MKQQKLISIERNASGEQVNFERWSCARPGTVKAAYEKMKEQSSLFNALRKADGVVSIDIYRTPDGYAREAAPALSFSLY